jgi:hypothetical protein
MEKIINRLIDEAVVDVDKYVNNNSTWLIFTESKQWVIELTKDGTLWYNYNFFKNLFVYMSMDVVENQHYITKWVEDNIINGVKDTQDGFSLHEYRAEEIIQNGVKEAKPMEGWVNSQKIVDKTIQNGVKETKLGAPDNRDYFIEDTIQNGVKKTKRGILAQEFSFEDAIQNGVKQTQGSIFDNPTAVKDTIQNGVKHTEYGDWGDYDERLEDIIQNGIKETKGGGYLGSITMGGKLVHMVESPNQNNKVDDVIQHGVIETFDETHHRRREVVRTIRDGIKQTCAQIPSIDAVVERVVEEGIKETHDDVYHHTARVEGVIRNGIKEVKGLPDMSGELRGYGDYYRSQKTMAKPHSLYVKDVIENGNKDTLKKSTY